MEYIEIYRTWDEQKAEQMKSLLEDYEISCYLTSHLTQSVMPFAGQQEVRLMVPKTKAEEAQKMLEDFFDFQPGEESTKEDKKS